MVRNVLTKLCSAVRIFGKPTTRVNRRMGVVLCYAPLDSDLDTLRDKAKRIADRVEVY